MRIRIRYPKNVQMDPDPDVNPDPRGVPVITKEEKLYRYQQIFNYGKSFKKPLKVIENYR